jgi:lipoyl-dependent peroxiredoxin subunit D
MPADRLERLRDALPPYARDTAANLDAVVGTPGRHLTDQQHWGTVLAVAAAVRAPTTTPVLAAEARTHLSPAAVDAALGAASVMAANAVYFRARHFLHGAYDDARAGLRMRLAVAPGVGRADFELWCVAVSAVEGCESCVGSHEAAARAAGLSREAVNDALRIAAVVHAVAAALEASGLV